MIEQGFVLFRELVIIPTMLRTKVLILLHQRHPGIQRMKSLACKYAYWPGMDHDIEEMVRVCGPCAAAADSPSKQHCTRGLHQPDHGSTFTQTLRVHIWEGTSSSSWMPTQSTLRSFQRPTQHPGRQWQFSVNCAPNMGFRRRSSVTMEHSLPHTSSGSSARLTPSVTFCHHCTTPNQVVGLNALSTPSSAASSNCEGREMWIKSWIHSCWLTE